MINLKLCKFVIMFNEIIIQPDITEVLEYSNKKNEEVEINVNAV